MAKKEISRPQTANIAPFGLRLQPELKERVELSAKENGRSMNAEITARLEKSFEPPQKALNLEVENQAVALRSRVDTMNMRLEVIRSRADSLDIRRRMVVAEAQTFADATTIEELERAKATAKQLHEIESEIARIDEEMKTLTRERAAIVKKARDLDSAIKSGQQELERRLSVALRLKSAT